MSETRAILAHPRYVVNNYFRIVTEKDLRRRNGRARFSMKGEAAQPRRCRSSTAFQLRDRHVVDSIIVMNLAAVLRTQLDAGQWTVIADSGLDLGPETLRYPDLVVDPAGGSADDYAATAPALIAEVLSPSAAGDKAVEYLRLPSLSAYLVLAQREAKAWLWTRGPEGFPAAPTAVAGHDKVVHVAALRLVIPLGAVHAGIDAG